MFIRPPVRYFAGGTKGLVEGLNWEKKMGTTDVAFVRDELTW